MKYTFPEGIRCNIDGYNIFVELVQALSAVQKQTIRFDFKNTIWFDANLSSVLGAIINKAQDSLNEVIIENLRNNIERILKRNHFLTHFGNYPLQNRYGTTVEYRKFKTNEEKLFKEYLDKQLLSKDSFPTMSSKLRKRINESIFEIFSNAIIHGDCKHIFSCGQYYRTFKQLDFTIVDLGRTIKNNVISHLDKSLSGKEAIEWAVLEGHTTKSGTIPGGLGLSLIREFLNKNKGKIQILSADGYWEQNNDNIIIEDLNKEFPGTIVNLAFNIADRSYYYLKSEVKPDEIF